MLMDNVAHPSHHRQASPPATVPVREAAARGGPQFTPVSWPVREPQRSPFHCATTVFRLLSGFG